jgi:hypothetical protein
MRLFWQKRVGLHFGRFFSKTHLVTLVARDDCAQVLWTALNVRSFSTKKSGS